MRLLMILFFATVTTVHAQNLKPFRAENGKYGYLTAEGAFAIEPYYDRAEPFSDGLGVVERYGRKMIINSAGKTIVEAGIYDHIYSYSEGLALVNKGAKFDDLAMAVRGGKWGFVDKKGTEVIPLIYEEAGSFGSGLAMVRNGGKCGFIDRTGKLVIPMKYDIATDYRNGFASVAIGARLNKTFNLMQGGLYTIVDPTGKEMMLPVFTYIWPFGTDGLAKVELNGGELGKGKYGFVDKTGKLVIPASFDDAHGFDGGFAVVNKGSAGGLARGGKWGIIDKSGKLLTEYKYDKLDDFVNPLAVAATHLDYSGYGKFGLVDPKGKEIVPLGSYEYITTPKQKGLPFVYRKDKKYGLLGPDGKELSAPVYDFIYDFQNGFAMVYKGKLYGAVNTEGKEIIPATYSYVGPFIDSLSHVILAGRRHGYFNTAGKEVIPNTSVDTVYGIREGMLLFEKSKKFGFVNVSKAKLVTTTPYDFANSFREGRGKVTLNNKSGYIDNEGKLVIPISYDIAALFSEGLAAVNTGAQPTGSYKIHMGGKWGYIDRNGKKIIAEAWDDADDFSEGMAAVNTGAKPGSIGMEGGLWGYIDKTGKTIIKPVYTRAGSFVNGRAYVTQNGRKFYIDKKGIEVK